jgi:uncharacterized protein with HEPN domain
MKESDSIRLKHILDAIGEIESFTKDITRSKNLPWKMLSWRMEISIYLIYTIYFFSQNFYDKRYD